MNYRVQISRRAEKQMRSLNNPILRRVRARINELGAEPYRSAAKLKSLSGFRQRVGSYRIVYEIDDDQRLVRVIGVEHRREAYR